MKSINDITDEEIFIELLDNPFTNDSEKQFIDSVVNSFQGPRKKISPDQRQALKAIIIRVRRRMKKSNSIISWLKFLPVENFRPKKDVCPKCGGKLIPGIYRIREGVYRSYLDCENAWRFDGADALCDYTRQVN